MFVFDPLTQADLPFLLEVRNECRELLHDNRAFTLAECTVWFRETKPDFHIIKYDEQRVGYFRLSNHDQANASIDIGADFHERFRGRGLARRAYEAFLPLLKEQYQVSVARLEVLSHNTVAQGLYQRLGFVEIGRKERCTVRNGVAVDSIVMAMRL